MKKLFAMALAGRNESGNDGMRDRRNSDDGRRDNCRGRRRGYDGGREFRNHGRRRKQHTVSGAFDQGSDWLRRRWFHG